MPRPPYAPASLVPEAPTLLPAPDELHVDWLVAERHTITVHASTRRARVACPRCGQRSRRVHRRYWRSLADLPWQGLAVRLSLRPRRCFCTTPTCPQHIFTERLPATAAPYARQTARLDATRRLMGTALGGAAGERRARALGITIAGSTRLAHRREAPAPDPPIPRVLGIDDFAWRRGHPYGTILVDLEHRRVVDLRPDRSAASVAAWPRAHPGVEIITRDRAGLYADGARAGAPEAIQIADRFHRLANLRVTLERLVMHHTAALRTADSVSASSALGKGAAARAARRAARYERYCQVVALYEAGVPNVEICDRLNLGRGTVRAWLRAGHFPERAAGPRGARLPTRLAPPVDHLTARWVAGHQDAAALVAELRVRGYTGTTQTVHRFLRRLAHTAGEGAVATTPPPSLPLSPRQTSWWLCAFDVELAAVDRALVAELWERCPALGRVRGLVQDFRRMLREHDASAVLPWLAAAQASEWRGYVRGLRADFEAVHAGIALGWSQGQVEGHGHRLKLVQRSMYGRAGFALRRRRVLAAAA